jgi:hypothetical protein
MLNRRACITQSLACVGALALGIEAERQFTVTLKDGELLCDTGREMVCIGNYHINVIRSKVNVEVWVDDDAVDSIKQSLEREQFRGTVTITTV